MTAFSFRRANLDDVTAVVALVESAYRGDHSRAGWTTEADLLGGQRTDPEEVRDAIAGARGRSAIVLCERDGALVACAHVADDHGAGYFGMFAVSPLQQGTGLGKLVLAEAERIARDDWHLPVMRMTVIDIRDELIAFYVRRGYARTGETRPFPYGDPRFGEPKRDDLRFVVLAKTL